MGSAFDLYLFDLDGTLIDSSTDLTRAVNLCRRDLGLSPIAEAVVRGYIGEGARRLVERALGPERDASVDEALALFWRHYREHLLDNTRAYPGISELLQALEARGARLAVITNKPEEFSRAILAGLELDRHFDIVLGGDSLPARKPDPLPVNHALGESGTTRDRALLVGDSRIDVETARNAEVAVCAVTYGLERREVLEALEPDFLADRPAEVLTATR